MPGVQELPASASNVLVVYFSHSGNTREIATQIHECVGGDVFEIVPVDPYPVDYDAVVAQAKGELSSGHRPALKARLDQMDSYGVVFVGYPNWWGTVPPPVRTFLSEHDVSAKTVVPFCTHEGSRLGRSAVDIAKLCPRSTILDGLAIKGGDVQHAQSKVAEWLQGLKLSKQGTPR